MKYLKLFEKFTTEELLNKINFQCDSDRYHTPQLNTTSRKFNKEFITYLWSIADIKRIDALGGTQAPQSLRRYDISDLIEFKDVIHMAETGIVAGIKVIKYPLFKMMEYELWPGGYIEGFIRMSSDDQRFDEYFIWTYIRMDFLKEILDKYRDKLQLF